MELVISVWFSKPYLRVVPTIAIVYTLQHLVTSNSSTLNLESTKYGFACDVVVLVLVCRVHWLFHSCSLL